MGTKSGRMNALRSFIIYITVALSLFIVSIFGLGICCDSYCRGYTYTPDERENRVAGDISSLRTISLSSTNHSSRLSLTSLTRMAAAAAAAAGEHSAVNH